MVAWPDPEIGRGLAISIPVADSASGFAVSSRAVPRSFHIYPVINTRHHVHQTGIEGTMNCLFQTPLNLPRDACRSNARDRADSREGGEEK